MSVRHSDLNSVNTASSHVDAPTLTTCDVNVVCQYALHIFLHTPRRGSRRCARRYNCSTQRISNSHKYTRLGFESTLTASSFPWGGTTGKIVVLRNGFGKVWDKAWVYNADPGVNSGGSETSTQVQCAALVQDQSPKACAFRVILCLHWPTERDSRFHPHPYTPTIQKSNTGTSHLRQHADRHHRGSSAVPSTPPLRLLLASSGLLTFSRPAVEWALIDGRRYW